MMSIIYNVGNLEIYNSVYKYVGSNMYLIINGREALIIDPHKEENVTQKLKEHKINKVIILITHEHHDHTSGIYWFQENFITELICQRDAAELMASRRYMRPMIVSYILKEQDCQNSSNTFEEFNNTFVLKTYKADTVFDNQLQIEWEGHIIDFYHTPGHSKGSCLIIID